MKALITGCCLFISSIFSYSQVILQSGSSYYSLPIFSFSDPKSGLGTSISMNYNSGNGFLVNSVASNTGSNWTLAFGGFIARKQVGEPDDQNSTPLFSTYPYDNTNGYNSSVALAAEQSDPALQYIENYYPNGFMYSEFPVDISPSAPLTYAAPRELTFMPRFRSANDKNWKLSRRTLADREQDIYMYNFNGISGEFVIGKDGNPLLLNDAKVQITKTEMDITNQIGENTRTRITQFTIKDANGLLYIFSSNELSEVLKFVETSREGTNEFQKIVSTGEPANQFTADKFNIHKWMLTQIVNPTNGESIQFQYENYSVDFLSDKLPTYEYTETPYIQSVQIYEQRSKFRLKRIKNIIFPDGHRAEFIYTSSPARIDVPGDNPLQQIKIWYNDKSNIWYEFNYGYFLKKEVKLYTDVISEPLKRFARLCLVSIQKKTNSVTEPPYKFTYYTGIENSDLSDIVPPTDCLAQDHWGFYNKSSVVNIDDANPTKEVIKSLMLNASSYRIPSIGAAKLGLLKSIENPFGGLLTFEYEQNESKNSDNESQTVIAGGVRVNKITAYDGVSSSNNVVTNYYYKKSDGTTSGWGYEDPVYQLRREIRIWNASAPSGYVEMGIMRSDISTTMAKRLSTEMAKTALSSNNNNSEKPGESMPPVVKQIYNLIIAGLVDRIFALIDPTDYVWLNTYNFYPQGSHNSLGIHYSRVEVVNTSLPGGTGKIIQEFTAPVTVRSEIPALSFPFSSKQRYPKWRYDLPSRTEIRHQNGNLIKEIINSYNLFIVHSTSENHKSNKVEPFIFNSASCDAATYGLSVTDLAFDTYFPFSGRAELYNVIERNYDDNANISESQISHTYNSDFLPASTVTTKSNGDVILQLNYYANDYDNISPAIQEMKAKNMLAIPISTETWLIKPNSSQYLIDATINEFTLLTNGQIKLKKVYKLESKEPVPQAIIGNKQSNVLIRNTDYFKEQLNINYDNSGIASETTSPEGRISSQVFDYNQRFVVAQVINASQSDIAYSSFETTSKGGWDYDANLFTMNYGVTGKRCFHFPATLATITKTITANKSYILSFWHSGEYFIVLKDNVVLNPRVSVTNNITGWTYKEYEFDGAGTVLINNQGLSRSNILDLDELRLFPKDSRMATTAYDPLVGKITECDVNNRIVYYEYDELGRLILVRDDKKNVIRKICYNYTGQPENCNLSELPNWMPMGPIRCKPCESNPDYTYSNQQKQEIDINPQSPTYNQIRWLDLPANHTCQPAVWQATGDLRCVLDANNNNTGYQEKKMIDVNPCSPTYGTYLWQDNGINLVACPFECNTSNCSGNDKKCINGVCETGTLAVVSTIYKKVLVDGFLQWRWVCTWRYCFSDGSQSTYYEESIQTSACTITCFIEI